MSWDLPLTLLGGLWAVLMAHQALRMWWFLLRPSLEETLAAAFRDPWL